MDGPATNSKKLIVRSTMFAKPIYWGKSTLIGKAEQAKYPYIVIFSEGFCVEDQYEIHDWLTSHCPSREITHADWINWTSPITGSPTGEVLFCNEDDAILCFLAFSG